LSNDKPNPVPLGEDQDKLEQYCLCICEDRPDDPVGCIYSVYFVNNTDRHINELRVVSVGLAEEVKTGEGRAARENIPPRSYVEIGVESDDDFDFMLFFDLELEMSSQIAKVGFRTPKYLPAFHKPKPIPSLKKEGFIIAMRAAPEITDKKMPVFEDEADRIAYAEKSAKEWVATLPYGTVEQCGWANLISDEVHRLLLELPPSKTSRRKN
jgi:hypothetical protein